MQNRGLEWGAGRLAATIERLRLRVRDAEATAGARVLAGLATGVLMERLKCGPSQAAGQLGALAEAAGLSRLEAAADIVDGAARDDLSPRTPSDALTVVPRAQSNTASVGLRASESVVVAGGDAHELARSLLDNALPHLGAVAVAIWAATSGGSLNLAGHAGFSAAEARRWRYVPPTVVTLARQALDGRDPVWLPSLAGSTVPSIGRNETRDGGRAVLPAASGGRLLGVLEICWPGILDPQPPRVRRQVEALAALCAHTLDGHPEADLAPAEPDPGVLAALADILLAPAMILAPRYDPAGRLIDFLIVHANQRFADLAGRPTGTVVGSFFLEAYPLAAQDDGIYQKIERVHATGRPFRGEKLQVNALAGHVTSAATADVGVHRHGTEILITWHTHHAADRLTDLLRHAQRLSRIGGFEENLSTGEIIWNGQVFALFGLAASAGPIPLQRLRDHAHPDDAAAIGRFLGTLVHRRRPASATFRLRRPDLTARHIHVVAEPVLDAHGHLGAVRGTYQDASAQHWTEVALTATRDRLTHTELQAAEQNRLARQLQHAIMPPSRAPIDVRGIEIAVRYRPAEADNLVGGDWYDVTRMPAGGVMLSIGDIAGHGIRAATDMVVLRNALRGLTATGAGPARLLRWLNDVACTLTGSVTATAVCGIYDPVARLLRWARAGHPPPILLRDGRAAPLPIAEGPLLGAFDDAEYEESVLRLDTGDLLLMYTDGLIERRDMTLQHALDDLLAGLRTPGLDLDQRLDDLLTRSAPDTDDDTCIVAMRVT